MRLFLVRVMLPWPSRLDAEGFERPRPMRAVLPDPWYRRSREVVRRGPADGVDEHPPNLVMVVDGESLMPRTEVEDLTAAPAVAAAATKYLAALEPADEHQLLWCG